MPELINRNEMEFNAALKKAMECMSIRDSKSKQFESIESYLSGIPLFPCPVSMANL